jgi:molybdopterin-guanine dinucleotide biosynthesis protein A
VSEPPRRSAVVLAGGRSSRFGRDKLAEPIGGRPLLDLAIQAVRPLAMDVVVVAAPGTELAVSGGVRVVHDPVGFEGPLAGLAAGLGVAEEEVVLVVGGDMPTLVAAVLESMASGLDDPAIAVVVLAHDGRPRPLPMVVRRAAALRAARSSLDGGDRRLRALIEGLPARVIPEDVWRGLDPGGATLRDIDTPADLP